MPLKTHLRALRWGGLAACGLQIGAAAAIPVATYILITKPYGRFATEDYVHWGISLVAGGWGMMALGSMRTVALAIHVVFGAMVAAALSAHNSSEYADLEMRCATTQQAFMQCGACACAALNTCSWKDFASDGACPGCQAPGAEFCADFNVTHNKIMLAITGPATVLIMAVPVLFSLLALLRVECASGIEASNRVAQALAIVSQQLVHLSAREDLSAPLDTVMESVRLVEEEGGPAMQTLADHCRTGLARAGFNVPPRDYDKSSKKSKNRGDDSSISVHASPPSFAPSHHSAHSNLQSSHPSMTTSGALLLPPEQWRTPSATVSRVPQPAAMTFTSGSAHGGAEGSIYHPSHLKP